jgi:PAS domain S-box-containing protein
VDSDDRVNDEPRRESLGTSDAQLLNALKVARAGHWQYDIPGDRFTFNDQFYSIFGTTAQAVGGYTMTSAEYMKRFVHPDDAALVRRAIKESIETTDPTYGAELAHRALFADGREGYILARWFSVKDARGRTIMTYGVNRDITDLKRYEQRATESEGQFKSLVEQQVAGIVILRYDGNVAYVNRRFAGMLGYAVNEVIGQPFLSFIADRDRDTILDRTRRRFAGQGDPTPSTCAVRRRDGTPLDVLAQSTLATWQGRPALIGVLIDYSEHKQAERAMQQAIEALAGTVELRDPYTAGHQRRVSRLACAIARELRMPESQIAGLRLVSAVHDIGKVLVPTEILSKPGKLTDIEYQMVQQHAEAGYNILKGVEFPWPVAQTVLQHHERLNGSGYPRGLGGEAILAEAKVLAVADVVDSMMARRPYHEKLGIDAALHEIEAGKGKLYDPAAVDACILLFRQKAFSFE